jgi:hypothetical protein
MSKRFGRNQRRRAREQISKLEVTISNYKQAYERDLGMLRQIYEKAQHQLQRLQKLLGNNFIGFDAQIQQCEKIDEYLKLRIAVKKPLNFVHSGYFNTIDSTVSTVELDKFIFYLEKDLRKFNAEPSYQMHFRLKCSNGVKAGYALDFESFYGMPKEMIIQILTENFSWLIADYFENKNILCRRD